MSENTPITTPEEFYQQPSATPEEVAADVFGGVKTSANLSVHHYALGELQQLPENPDEPDGDQCLFMAIATPDKHVYEVWFRDVGVIDELKLRAIAVSPEGEEKEETSAPAE